MTDTPLVALSKRSKVALFSGSFPRSQ